MTTAINNFIFETAVISPISDIIVKLENKEFRDCDVNWLNGKLKAYTDLALQTLGKQIEVGEAVGGTMNEHNRNRFISYFTTLLDYFKSF